MPDSVVVRCSVCGIHQVITQQLPALDEYFNCLQCSAKDGEPLRQPCKVYTMPDGRVLRSYDVRAMRLQAKKLNAESFGDQQDLRLSSQKLRVEQTLEEQKQRRLQVSGHAPWARARAPVSRAMTMCMSRAQIREKLRTGELSEDMIRVLEKEDTAAALSASRRSMRRVQMR